MTRKKLSLRDVILVALIAVIFGAIFVATDLIYAPLYVAIGPFANEVLFGLWIMAGPLSLYLIRIPGTAIIGEVLAALAEVFFGGTFGAAALISGLVQGVGSELGFAVYRYRQWGWLGLATASLGTTVTSFAYEMFKAGYVKMSLGMILALFCVRLLSTLFFGTVLVKGIVNLLARARVVNFS